MGKPQIIYQGDQPAFAVIPWKDYLELSGGTEAGLSDEALYDRAKEADEESFPAELANRLLDGFNPIKVFREYRGLTQARLARQVGTSPAYLSQIETGKRTGGLKLLRAIAATLNVDLDDLVAGSRARRSALNRRPA